MSRSFVAAFAFVILCATNCLVDRAFADDRVARPSAGELTPEEEDLLLGEATRFAAVGDYESAWLAIAGEPGTARRDTSLADVEVGSRALVVAGFLRNQDLYDAEVGFARYSLAQAWLRAGHRGMRGSDRAQIRFLAARLELHLPDGRGRAMALLRQAHIDDPDLRAAADLEDELARVDRAFGRSSR